MYLSPSLCFSAAIYACEQCGKWDSAIQILGEMQRFGIAPNAVRYFSVFTFFFAAPRPLMRRIEQVCYNTAISACARRGKWEPALKMLESMRVRGVKADVVSFSATMNACTKGGQWEKALKLLDSMESCNVKPNKICFNVAISACEQGRQHERAFELLSLMQGRGFKPDLYSYNACIGACGRAGEWKRAIQLLIDMETHGVAPDLISFNRAVGACGRSGEWEKALEVMGVMEQRGMKPDGITYKTTASACEKAGQIDQAFRLFELSAGAGYIDKVGVGENCTRAEAVAKYKLALSVHGKLRLGGLKPDTTGYHAVLDSYLKAGKVSIALDVFSLMKNRGFCNTTTFNSIMRSCSSQGQHDRVIELYTDMKRSRIQPDNTTFETAISSFQSKGAWEKAMEVLAEMQMREIG